MLDRSGKPPDTLQHPISLQHAPDATLAVKLNGKDRGIIITRAFSLFANIRPCQGAAPAFPSSTTIPRFIYTF